MSFPVPQAYRKLVKEEINIFAEIVLSNPVSESKWSIPLFVIPKKDKTVRFLTNFTSLNE